MDETSTQKRINRAKKLLLDVLILLEEIDTENPSGPQGNGFGCLAQIPDKDLEDYHRKDFL